MTILSNKQSMLCGLRCTVLNGSYRKRATFYNGISTLIICVLSLVLFACGGGSDNEEPVIQIETSSPPVSMPSIANISISNNNIEQFGLLELSVELFAEFNNPFDQREVALNLTFSGPNSPDMIVAGFWDEQQQWTVRFAPPTAGRWEYKASVKDERGISEMVSGQFDVAASNRKGMIKVGSDVNPLYSSRYFAYQNGEPFYGIGHSDAFSIFRLNNPAVDAQRLVDNMDDAGENYVMWWPQFYFSLIQDSFDNYKPENLQTIDAVIDVFEKANKTIVFTIWDHSQLRDAIHPWLEGNWDRNNGFNRIISATDFFTDDEAWAWQSNLYRYMIARWGHSSAIGVWQIVSEIDGTNAFENGDVWHQRVNAFFVENDPYKHVTTSSRAGDLTWDEGHAVMDMPQVHIYQDLLNPDNNDALPIQSAQVIANYTHDMWDLANKPNWIGEFGVINADNTHYPELFHHSIWAALASGGAMTPAEWNDFDRWGVMTNDMKNHMRYLSEFVSDLPLVQLNPIPITAVPDNINIRAWALVGDNGGLLWAQDTTLQGQTTSHIRQNQVAMPPSNIDLVGLTSGRYLLSPFNTWQGVFEESTEITCLGTPQQACRFTLPMFSSDIAIKIERIRP